MPHAMTARLGATTLIATLLVVASPGSSEARDYKPWGSVSSKNHVLKRGCHDYTYRYRITAPTDAWSAEIFLVAPDGTGLASDVLDTAADPAHGKKKITVCRPSTQVGKHRLKMKVTWTEGRNLTDGYVKPSTFRFTRR